MYMSKMQNASGKLGFSGYGALRYPHAVNNQAGYESAFVRPPSTRMLVPVM